MRKPKVMRSYRLSQEDADKLADIAEAMGKSQAEVISLLLRAMPDIYGELREATEEHDRIMAETRRQQERFERMSADKAKGS